MTREEQSGTWAVFDPPTPWGLRGMDAYGDGAFGAVRAVSHGSKSAKLCECDGAIGGHPKGARHRAHWGVDFVAEPGKAVKSPCDGVVTRVGWPYMGDPRFHLMAIKPDGFEGWEVRLLYVRPNRLWWDGEWRVKRGDTIGTAEDLRERYPADENHAKAITPHVHFEVRRDGKPIDPFAPIEESAQGVAQA